MPEPTAAEYRRFARRELRRERDAAEQHPFRDDEGPTTVTASDTMALLRLRQRATVFALLAISKQTAEGVDVRTGL